MDFPGSWNLCALARLLSEKIPRMRHETFIPDNRRSFFTVVLAVINLKRDQRLYTIYCTRRIAGCSRRYRTQKTSPATTPFAAHHEFSGSVYSRASVRFGSSSAGTTFAGNHSTSKLPRYPNNGPQVRFLTLTSMRNRPDDSSNHSQ